MVRRTRGIPKGKNQVQSRACLPNYEMYFRIPKGLLQRHRKESQPTLHDFLAGKYS